MHFNNIHYIIRLPCGSKKNMQRILGVVDNCDSTPLYSYELKDGDSNSNITVHKILRV